MRKVGILAVLFVLVLPLVGCSSNDTTQAPAPSGARPNTTTAPPGSKNPEERGMEAERNGTAGKGSDQDGAPATNK